MEPSTEHIKRSSVCLLGETERWWGEAASLAPACSVLDQPCERLTLRAAAHTHTRRKPMGELLWHEWLLVLAATAPLISLFDYGLEQNFPALREQLAGYLTLTPAKKLFSSFTKAAIDFSKARCPDLHSNMAARLSQASEWLYSLSAAAAAKISPAGVEGGADAGGGGDSDFETALAAIGEDDEEAAPPQRFLSRFERRQVTAKYAGRGEHGASGPGARFKERSMSCQQLLAGDKHPRRQRNFYSTVSVYDTSFNKKPKAQPN
jgi:hypothetical protein